MPPGIDTFTLSVGALALVITTAAAWGTLRANVRANATALLAIEQEVRRLFSEEVGAIEKRLHNLELRFERSKGREEARHD